MIAFAVVAAMLTANASPPPPVQSARRQPTVGDTIWVRRAVALPPRYGARATDWQLSGDVELLGRPQLTLTSDSVVVRYPLVAWVPGTHTVAVPAPFLLGPDGSLDSLPPLSATFTIASVLPDRPVASLRPQPPAGLVTRGTVSLLPPLLIGLLAVALVAPVQWWWRRRGRPIPPSPPPEPASVPVARWAEAGETRSVLALAARRVRGAIERAEPEAHQGLDTRGCIAVLEAKRPGWPIAELAALLDALDAARFAPEAREEAIALYRAADALAGRIEGLAA